MKIYLKKSENPTAEANEFSLNKLFLAAITTILIRIIVGVVLREDLIAYLHDREIYPEKYQIPNGAFSSVEPKRSKESFPMELPQDFREWLEDEWHSLPEVLTADMIRRRTGYTKKTVLRWMRTKRLRCVVMPHDRVTTKDWLVEFYCGKGYMPRYMCEKHKKLVRRYLKER